MSTIHGNTYNVNIQPIDAKAMEEAEHQARLHHAREVEEKAAKLEKENDDLRLERAAEDRLHKAQQEHDHLQHPSSLPFPLNVLLHTQAENEGTQSNVVAVADTAHGAYEVHATEHDGDASHAVEAIGHPADDHSAPDAAHAVDHSHDVSAEATA